MNHTHPESILLAKQHRNRMKGFIIIFLFFFYYYYYYLILYFYFIFITSHFEEKTGKNSLCSFIVFVMANFETASLDLRAVRFYYYILYIFSLLIVIVIYNFYLYYY